MRRGDSRGEMSHVALNYLLSGKLYFINPGEDICPLYMTHPNYFITQYSAEPIALAGRIGGGCVQRADTGVCPVSLSAR